MTTTNIELTTAELDLLIEALSHRASRHESMGRFNPRSAGPHDRAAKAMRKLEGRLLLLADKVD